MQHFASFFKKNFVVLLKYWYGNKVFNNSLILQKFSFFCFFKILELNYTQNGGTSLLSSTKFVEKLGNIRLFSECWLQLDFESKCDFLRMIWVEDNDVDRHAWTVTVFYLHWRAIEVGDIKSVFAPFSQSLRGIGGSQNQHNHLNNSLDWHTN